MLALAAAQACQLNPEKRDFNFIMRESLTSPGRPSKIRRSMAVEKPIQLSKEEALSLTLETYVL